MRRVCETANTKQHAGMIKPPPSTVTPSLTQPRNTPTPLSPPELSSSMTDASPMLMPLMVLPSTMPGDGCEGV